MKRTGTLAAVAMLGAIASCTNRPLVKTEPKTESYVMQVLKQAEFVPIDVIVVVDNSRSMTEEQINLAEEFPALIRELLDPPIGEDGKPAAAPQLILETDEDRRRNRQAAERRRRRLEAAGKA